MAIVRSNFKIPKTFTIKELTFGYTDPHKSLTYKNASSSATFSYPKVTNIDLSIETGAFYDGRWGGSKLSVIYND